MLTALAVGFVPVSSRRVTWETRRFGPLVAVVTNEHTLERTYSHAVFCLDMFTPYDDCRIFIHTFTTVGRPLCTDWLISFCCWLGAAMSAYAWRLTDRRPTDEKRSLSSFLDVPNANFSVRFSSCASKPCGALRPPQVVAVLVHTLENKRKAA